MKQGYTHIIIVLDRSGSMDLIRTETISGFNGLVNEQKTLPGAATLSLVQFDHDYEVLHTNRPLTDIPLLDATTFVPRGYTALLDAIGRTINEEGQRLADMPEADRPEKLLFIILTDGEENSSREFSKAKIKEMITHQSEVYNWQFIFMGANQDAVLAGGELGIAQHASFSFAANRVGTVDAFTSLSTATSKFRANAQSKTVAFDPADRQKQTDAGAWTSK